LVRSTTAVPAKVVSGGQTGVDRAALDAALALGILVGGWCPRGRRAEDGRIEARYPLDETPSRRYSQRTEWNVRDSDGTLILSPGAPRGGTLLTAKLARCHGRPLLILDLDADTKPIAVRHWLHRHGIRVLNVAGPRASGAPGVYERSLALLLAVLRSDGPG